MDDIPPEIKGELRNRIRADLLRIHAKRLERADLRDCLRECYDTYVPDLRDAGWQLTEVLLSESIPRWVFQWAWVRGWLFATVRYARYPISEDRLADSVRNALSGRIAYWRAEMLAPAVPEADPDPAAERARREQEKRERLLARALSQFPRALTRRAKMGDLARQIGVSRTTLYRWVDDPSSVGTENAAAIPLGLRRIADKLSR